MDRRTASPSDQISGRRRRGAEGRRDAGWTVGKRRFIWSDRDAHQQLGNDVDVRGTDNQERRKGARGLCDAELVYPDDMLVGVRDFSAVMVVMGDFVVAMAVRREVTMGDRRVIGRIRFVHMLPGDHGRQGEPWHQRRDNQDAA